MLTKVCRETSLSCQDSNTLPSGVQVALDSLTSLSIPKNMPYEELERWIVKHFPKEHILRQVLSIKENHFVKDEYNDGYDAGYQAGINNYRKEYKGRYKR